MPLSVRLRIYSPRILLLVDGHRIGTWNINCATHSAINLNVAHPIASMAADSISAFGPKVTRGEATDTKGRSVIMGLSGP